MNRSSVVFVIVAHVEEFAKQSQRGDCTRNCAARVTVVVSCVCVFVCVCVCVCVRACVRACVCVVSVCLSAHAILAVRAIRSITKDAIVLSVRFAAILKWHFS